MLSRLLFVRLKAAENALRDGRIDEAYRLATAPDICEHRRGAAVLAQLTERFIERARNHYRADRFTEAEMDLDRAATGGVSQEEIAELRENIRTVAAEQQRRERSRHDRLAAAKRRIEGGSLAGGKRLLEQASENDLDAAKLKRVVDERADNVAAIVAQAEGFIAQGHMAEAAKRLQKARSIDAHDESATRVEKRLCDQVMSNARAAIVEGKLGRASDELACLGRLGENLPAKRELTEMLAIANRAAHCVRNGQYAEARRHAMTLERLAPKAKWVHAVVDQLRRMDEIISALSAGPIGNPGDGAPAGNRIKVGADTPWTDAPVDVIADMGENLEDTVALPAIPQATGSLPDRLLLLVDGGGSYLIVRAPQASVGRAASTQPADIAIYSDVAERHANVTRVDDDYFVFGAKEVEVAGRKTKHQLLRDGDRIVLGKKAKMTFRLPSRKSPTAVLDLSDTTKMPSDVRRVVLFHRHAIVGSGNSAHIRCQHAGTPIVLFERNGTLWMRLKNDGHVDTEPVPLPLGETVELGGVSLVLEPWRVHGPGARKV